MQPATRAAIEALIYARTSDASTPDAETTATRWTSRLAGTTLSTYRRGGLVGRPPPHRRPLDWPRTFFRSSTSPKRWDPAEPRTKRPRPPSAPHRPAAEATESAVVDSGSAPAHRPMWVDCNSHRIHARSGLAYKPVLPRPQSARIFHTADPQAAPTERRSALKLREPMGEAIHGEWIGCGMGVVKHRGAWGSAPGWVDFSREATCVSSRGRVRRPSAATPPAPRQQQRGSQRDFSPNAQREVPPHAVLQYDARQMHDLITLGAERLQSASKAKLKVKEYRTKQRRAKLQLLAATLIQARWRSGRTRRLFGEMLWAAMTIQANIRTRKAYKAFHQKLQNAFSIQRLVRGYLARRSLQQLHENAVIIQALYRGWSVRYQVASKIAKDREIIASMARIEHAAAVRMQAVYRGYTGRRKARAEALRSMDEQQRLTEVQRAQRAKQSDVLLKQQAVKWQEQQKHDAMMLEIEQARERAQELEGSGMGPGDTGAVIRVMDPAAPGYGTFVAVFGSNKISSSNWIAKSSGDGAFRASQV